jgi:hypothetical protein
MNLIGASAWRWRARPVADGKFLMRFQGSTHGSAKRASQFMRTGPRRKVMMGVPKNLSKIKPLMMRSGKVILFRLIARRLNGALEKQNLMRKGECRKIKVTSIASKTFLLLMTKILGLSVIIAASLLIAMKNVVGYTVRFAILTTIPHMIASGVFLGVLVLNCAQLRLKTRVSSI